jgi:hypothetical protein
MSDSTGLHFAWLDANMYSDDNKQLLKKIRGINKETMEFTEEDECLRFLGRGVGDPRQFVFIVSGNLGEKLVPDIQERDNVRSIYIYCGWREKHEKWAKQYPKVGDSLSCSSFFNLMLILII